MRSSFFLSCCLIACTLSVVNRVQAESILVEAESFSERGGWSLDTQFITSMGSPYLLAHGLGKPVADAHTEIEFPSTGKYHIFVRTKDWVARWKAPGQPGRFQVLINDKAVDQEFGTEGAQWHWQSGGVVDIQSKKAKISLRDLTGFEGRCDAIYFQPKRHHHPTQARSSHSGEGNC